MKTSFFSGQRFRTAVLFLFIVGLIVSFLFSGCTCNDGTASGQTGNSEKERTSLEIKEGYTGNREITGICPGKNKGWIVVIPKSRKADSDVEAANLPLIDT